MQILIVGNDAPGALERYCASALQRLGHVVRFHDVYAQIIARSKFLYTPILYDLEQAYLRKGFNRRFISEVKNWKPDLVFVFKGIELTQETLWTIRSFKARPLLINWNPDNPFDTATFNTSKQLLKSIPTFDVNFIWDSDLIAPLRDAGSQRAEYLPFGYDPASHYPAVLTVEERDQFRSEVCFVGNYTHERAAFLAALAMRDVEVAVWGISWKEYLPSDSLLLHSLRGSAYGEAMAKAYSACDIAINFLRAQNGNAHNMRTFEVPAIGAFMLSTRSRSQMAWLPDREAAAYFTSVEEMCELVEHYLAHGNERRRIAAEGHQQITSGKNTYLDRMEQLISMI